MANLLVMYDNADANQSYPKFDVIAVREDGIAFGTGEGYPTFLKVHLHGVSAEDASFLKDVQFDAAGEIDYDTGKPQEIQYKRAYKIAESRLNPPTLAAIDAVYQANEIMEVENATDMLGWLEKKIDGSQPPAWGQQ